MTHPLSPTDISIFSPEIRNFHYIKKFSCRLHFNTKFLNILNFFKCLKVVLINMVAILIVSAKLATLGPVEIKTF